MREGIEKGRGKTSDVFLNASSLDLVHAFDAAFNSVMKNFRHGPYLNIETGMNVLEIYCQWYSELICKPNEFWKNQLELTHETIEFWSQCLNDFSIKEKSAFINLPAQDKRFKGQLWQELPLFSFYQKNYLFFEKQALAFVEKNQSKNPKIAKQISFFTHQIINAISPANFVLTNPHVLSETIDSKGENLIRGFHHFLEDMIHGQGHWHIKMTDMNAFHVGKNIAMTKGKVIYQNRMMELIQYSPTAAQVYERPLFIVPPWINKYYILDLSENNSYIKWIVEQGFTVFVISWVNPDASFSETTFEDYLFEGVFEALDAILKISAKPTVNALGFCIGGTLLAVALAYMKAKNDNRIHSATFLTTLIDFSEPGAIETFIDEKQIKTIEKRMKAEGFLDGRLLMTAFNILRSNELLWSFYVNNYLFGHEPQAFDLLFWNCDSTNLPMKMHSEYLNNFYLHNRLTQNELMIQDVRVDLSLIEIPTYFVAMEQDHIAPWKACFEGAKYLGGDVTFVLGGSGHISGVVNPPSQHKYSFCYTKEQVKLFQEPQAWLDNAIKEEGSWWSHWSKWLKLHSGAKHNALMLEEGLKDAPGEYVLQRIL